MIDMDNACVGLGGYYLGLCDGNCMTCPYSPDYTEEP